MRSRPQCEIEFLKYNQTAITNSLCHLAQPRRWIVLMNQKVSTHGCVERLLYFQSVKGWGQNGRSFTGTTVPVSAVAEPRAGRRIRLPPEPKPKEWPISSWKKSMTATINPCRSLSKETPWKHWWQLAGKRCGRC